MIIWIDDLDDLDPIMLDRGLTVYEHLTGLVFVCTNPDSASWTLRSTAPENVEVDIPFKSIAHERPPRLFD